jgi:hypothetical protein
MEVMKIDGILLLAELALWIIKSVFVCGGSARIRLAVGRESQNGHDLPLYHRRVFRCRDTGAIRGSPASS